jgi:cellulose synthase/poly-beta-1,6-N-acetylglucosamine synthase-like glycosyltransferase
MIKDTEKEHKKPLVTVIVPVKDERTYIKECVLSLSRQSYPAENLKIIVVIDRAGDGLINLDLNSMPIENLTVVMNTKKGPAAARNLGVSLADKYTDFFAFTDADCVASESWVYNLIEAITSLPQDVCCVGGENRFPQNDPVIAKLLGYLEQTLIGGGGSAQGSVRTSIRQVRSIPNCNALYRARCWHENKQDESLIVGQDGEFNYRLEKKGWRFMVIPDVIVYHHRPGSVIKHAIRMWRYGFATARICKKHPGILRVRWYALPSVLLMSGSLTLVVLGYWWPMSWTLLAVGFGLYAVLLLFITLQVMTQTGMWQSLAIPFLLLVQHCVYAAGFVYGLLIIKKSEHGV